MKNFKKLMLLAMISITAQSSVIARHDDNYDMQDDMQPQHQGFGRIFTAAENTLTLHPGNAVNSLATGDQADTSFGYHKNENGRIKANRANTKRNKQERKKDQEKRKKQEAKNKKMQKQKSAKKQQSKKSDSQE